VDRLMVREGTDSWRVLVWLSRCWRPRTPEKLRERLAELLELLHDYSALNLLLSDGESLYALCAYTKDADYYTLWVHEGEGLVAVASEPADTRRTWHPLENRELFLINPEGLSVRMKVG
ncbi:MAG: class II glutamine amidotransferase, partial [Candidatus Bipolaricaulaceae bacterium]